MYHSSFFSRPQHRDDLREFGRVEGGYLYFVRWQWRREDRTNLPIRAAFQEMPSRPPSFDHDRPLVFRFVFPLVPAVLDRLQNDIAG
jgi:hypothetical protein